MLKKLCSGILVPTDQDKCCSVFSIVIVIFFCFYQKFASTDCLHLNSGQHVNLLLQMFKLRQTVS